MHTWLLLHYKIAAEPSARRVYIWRKLKRLGAVLVQDTIWVLPHTSQTLEQFQWLTAEIVEMEGEAHLWQAARLLPFQDSDLVAQFTAQVDELYHQIHSELQQENRDLAALSRRYQQAQTRDYFQSPLGLRVRAALLSTREEISK
jgi:hypothetical protein